MPVWIIVLIVVGALIVLFGAIALFYIYALPIIIVRKMRNSPNPDGEMTYPENFEELAKKTEIIKDLEYPSAYPSNKYNLYLPTERKAEDKFPLIVWIHGGGFIGGTKDGGDNVMISLCAAGYAVASIDYAVAPEYKYPTAVRQVAEFAIHISSILKKYPCIDGNNVIFGGDSAGAQIAAQFTAAKTNPTLAQSMNLLASPISIKAVVLICGPFDLPALRAYAKRTNKLFRIVIDIWGRAYFGKLRWYKSKESKQTVITYLLTADFPPTFLSDGNKGSFEVQNRKLADKLRDLKVPVEELYFDTENGEVPHEYLFHLHEENSQLCMNKILSFLDKISS